MSSDQLIERWCKDHATRMCIEREREIIKRLDFDVNSCDCSMAC
jgi:hypothetical protein